MQKLTEIIEHIKELDIIELLQARALAEYEKAHALCNMAAALIEIADHGVIIYHAQSIRQEQTPADKIS